MKKLEKIEVESSAYLSEIAGRVVINQLVDAVEELQDDYRAFFEPKDGGRILKEQPCYTIAELREKSNWLMQENYHTENRSVDSFLSWLEANQ